MLLTMKKQETFSDRILTLLGDQKPTPWGLSIGLNNGLIDRIFRQGVIPRAEHLLKISNSLGVSVDWLLSGKEPVKRGSKLHQAYTPDELEYTYKLLSILREKDRTAIGAITHIIDALLKMPDAHDSSN